MADNIRVLVAIEVRLYRDGLAGLLSREPGISVVGIAATNAAAEQLARDLCPHVVLLDCALDRDGIVVRRLRVAVPGMRVVALGLPDSEPEVLAYAQAGISGYVTCEGSREELVAAIRSAANDEFLCSPRVAAALLRQVATTATVSQRAAERLTRREQEVAELMRQDLTNKAIATRLHIELSTVKNHVHRILEKMHVRHRRDMQRI